jgi:hypothetical protein
MGRNYGQPSDGIEKASNSQNADHRRQDCDKVVVLSVSGSHGHTYNPVMFSDFFGTSHK